MGPPQGRAEGEENLPRPAAHTPPHAPQDPIGLLGTEGTLLAQGHPVVPQDTQVPLRRAAPTATLRGADTAREKRLPRGCNEKYPSTVVITHTANAVVGELSPKTLQEAKTSK